MELPIKTAKGLKALKKFLKFLKRLKLKLLVQLSLLTNHNIINTNKILKRDIRPNRKNKPNTTGLVQKTDLNTKDEDIESNNCYHYLSQQCGAPYKTYIHLKQNKLLLVRVIKTNINVKVMAIKNRITDVGNILDANYYQKTIETRKYQKKSQIELRNNIFITKGWTKK